jgi:hypothetical protein
MTEQQTRKQKFARAVAKRMVGSTVDVYLDADAPLGDLLLEPNLRTVMLCQKNIIGVLSCSFVQGKHKNFEQLWTRYQIAKALQPKISMTHFLETVAKFEARMQS